VRRLFAVVLALAAFVPLALAQPFPFDFNTFRQWDVGDVPAGDPYRIFNRKLIPADQATAIMVPRDSNPRWCGELRLGPPGHMDKALPYAELWGFAVVDSGPGWSASDVSVAYRWRTWYPGDYSRIYYGPWTGIFGDLDTRDTLYAAPIWGGDTLGWFNDIEFRAYGARSNDSTYLSFWVVRRTWK